MKIKCTDYLPKKEGDYETDLGVLTLMYHGYYIKKWYKYSVRIIKNYKCLSYEPVTPIWWDNTEI